MIELKIITPEKLAYEDSVSEITIPTEDGIITVLPDHAPLVSILKHGELRIKKDDKETSLAVSVGVLEVRKKSRVVVLAGTTERVEEIDIKRAEEAYARAEKLLGEKDLTDPDYVRIKELVDKNLNRIHLVKRRRPHTPASK